MTGIKPIYFFIFLFTLQACINPGNADTPKDQRKDSLTVPGTPATMTTREFAVALLNGKARALDDSLTFSCLDSLLSPVAATRAWCFPVFRVIMKQSDGALSEALGGYAKDYLAFYTAEALHNLDKLDKYERQMFIDHIAFEFYAGDDYRGEIGKYYDRLAENCKGCPVDGLSRLHGIKEQLLLSAKKMED